MKDNNWDLISGPDAHDIEVLNYANQVNVIEAIFKLLMYHYKSPDGTCLAYPNANALKELHRTGTIFLLNEPGTYRSVEVSVFKDDSVVYQPPAAAEIEKHMELFFQEIMNKWRSSKPVHLGAFALWRLNWIHPFKNGNGRSARAFCYACLCLKYGFMLPGSPTVIDLIMADGAPYQGALQQADRAFSDTSTPDVSAMEQYLEGLLVQQLSHLPQPPISN